MKTLFTENYQNVMDTARMIAMQQGAEHVESNHVITALEEHKGALAFELLHKLGITSLEAARVPVQGNEDTPHIEVPRLSPFIRDVVAKSVLVAAEFEHGYVGTEHLLLSMVRSKDTTLSTLITERTKLSLDDIEKNIEAVLKNTSRFNDLVSGFNVSSSSDNPASMGIGTMMPQKRQEESILEFFATELTDEDAVEHTNPIIGRDPEIDRVIQILARREKNNPVLIGEPGVGKTAIVEGLAQRIIAGTVPEVLLNKRIYNLDLSLLLAGAMYRGEFEGRVKQLLEEVEDDDNIILFIDEIHMIVGAGAATGSLDAANMLKPALARGDIRLIGATTLDEYKKYIEPDSALERRLQVVQVKEPTHKEALTILQGIRDGYALYHNVAIKDSALEAAVTLSSRYLSERFLPDKAIDLIDEAAAKVKVSHAPRKEMQQVRKLEQQLSSVLKKKREAVESENFPEALALKEEERMIRRRLEEVTHDARTQDQGLYGAIEAEHIMELISHTTGIPVGELAATDMKHVRTLDKKLKKHIVGQHEAMHALAHVIKRSKVGLADPNRPIGSFMLLGPSGVGKTETAKVLAREVFNDPKALIRFDMSEFAEGFNTSRLLGAPAGYVGYKEGGQLTEAIRRKPYSVVLFDEIEKAHPEVFNVLLQVLDEGYVNDATGKQVDFRNTIILLTSNIGLNEFNEGAALGFEEEMEQKNTRKKKQRAQEEYVAIKTSVLESLNRKFRPELLNRLDHILVYQPLAHTHVKDIVKKECAHVARRMKERNITLTMDASLINWIAEKSFTPKEGARAVRRMVQEHITTPLADRLLHGEIEAGDTVTISVDEGKIYFK